MAPRTPAAPASSSTPSTASAGTMMNARSGGSARSRRLGTASLPNTAECRGWTGVSSPAKPVAVALAKTNPAQADVGEAPTTAMLRGAKNSARRPGETSEPGAGGRPATRRGPWLPRRCGVLGLGGASGGAAQPCSVLPGARASGKPPRGRSVLPGARASGKPPRGRSPAVLGYGPRLLPPPPPPLAGAGALDLPGAGGGGSGP